MRRNKENFGLKICFINVITRYFFLIFVVIYPLAYAFWMSLHKVSIFGGLKFKFIGFANYLKVITNEKFWDALTVSIRFTIRVYYFNTFLRLINCINTLKTF